MQSFSYRSFLIMDQLRKRASISVLQIYCVLHLDQSSYSRVSKRAYEGSDGVLYCKLESRVLLAIDVLLSGYLTRVITPTTESQPDSIIDVLLTLESELKTPAIFDAVAVDIDEILSKAGQLLLSSS